MVKKAYLLMIHKNPEQVNFLLHQLIDDDMTDVYIHVNKLSESLIDKLIKHKNIYILEDRVEVHWGDIGITDAMLLLLKTALNSGKEYDFISFKTGQDLKINYGLDDFLEDNKESIFMDVKHIPRKNPRFAHVALKWPNFTKRLYDGIQPARILRVSLIRLYQMGINPIPNPNKLPENFELFWGRTHFTIPFRTARFIIEFLNENSWYYDVFKNGLVADELFFQTIIMNSKYEKNVVNDNLTYVNKFQNNHPMLFSEEDIEKLEVSSKYFARKFDCSFDEKVVKHFVNKITSSKSK